MPVIYKKAKNLISGDILVSRYWQKTKIESVMDTGGQVFVFCNNGNAYPFKYEQDIQIWEDECLVMVGRVTVI